MASSVSYLLLLLNILLLGSLASALYVTGNSTKGVSQGGEDPDPEVQAKRNFVKQVNAYESNDI